MFGEESDDPHEETAMTRTGRRGIPVLIAALAVLALRWAVHNPRPAGICRRRHDNLPAVPAGRRGQGRPISYSHLRL